jgi:hypothetical protein
MDALKAGSFAPSPYLGGSTPPPLPSAQVPPPLPVTAAAPEAAGDAVILQQSDDGVRQYAHLRTNEGADAQVWQARNGASYHLVASQQGTQFEANIPAGLTQEPLQIVGVAGPNGTQAVAHPLGHPEQSAPAIVTHDGKIAVTLAPNGTLAMFDPTTLEYSVSTTGAPGAGGASTATQEVVHPDGSHTIKANMTVTTKAGGPSVGRMLLGGPLGLIPDAPEQEISYLRIDDKGGQVSAAQVTEHQKLQAAAGSSSQGLLGSLGSALGELGNLMGSPAHSETPVAVSRQQDGSYAVSGGGDLMQHMKDSLKNPFALQSPLASWLKSRNAPAQTIRSLAANPVVLSSMGASAGPAAAAAALVPTQPQAGVPTPPPLPR